MLSVSDERYKEFQKKTKADLDLKAVLTLVKISWPDSRQQVPVETRFYWTLRDEICNCGWIAFQGNTPSCPKGPGA